MARRKVVPPAAARTGPDAPPPSELLRFVPSKPAPIGPHGRPEPWAVKWTAEEFAAFLRARADWRKTHTTPLPGLFAMERYAMHQMTDRGELDRAVVAAEQSALTAVPKWVRRAQAASTMRQEMT
jgi:hypothetical protein